MKTKYITYTNIVSGLILLLPGLYLLETANEPQGIMRALTYIGSGSGCVLCGQSINNVLKILFVCQGIITKSP